MEKFTGIYFYSPVLDISGYGNVARNFLLALDKLGLPVFVHPHGAFDEEIGEEMVQFVKERTVMSPFELGDNILLITHCDPSAFIKINIEGLHITKQIGMTIFETDRIMPRWASNCNNLDEVWVPSEFNYETFKNSGVDESKLKIVRYPVNTKLFGNIDKYKQNEANEDFTFLYVSGYDYRKGYDLLVKSFCEAFTGDDNVKLILKIYVPHWSNGAKAVDEIMSYAKGYKNPPKIYINNDKITTEELLNLYSTADAYISTERASGWGMPEMEMMAMGKPVATIDWGGTTEYMDSSNSYPIKVTGEMEYVDVRLQEARPTYKGHKWACVNKENVISVLLDIYNNPEKRNAIAKKAREDVMTKLSPNAIAEELRSVLGL